MQDTASKRGTFRIVALYLAVTYGMAWALWFLAWLIFKGRVSLPIFPVLVVGSFGPFVGAAVATFAEGGIKRTLAFFARGFDPRMGWGVFLAAFMLMPAMAIGVEVTRAALAHMAPHFTMTWQDAPLSYVFLFVLGGTLAEEYGWSLLSDKLDGLLPLVPSTLVLGSIWAVWHLPLFYIMTPGAIQGYTPFPIFLVATVSMRFLFAWAYHRGGYNILSNMLFHTGSNMAYSVAAIAPGPDDPTTGRLWMFIGLTILCAAGLWLAFPIRPARPPPN